MRIFNKLGLPFTLVSLLLAGCSSQLSTTVRQDIDFQVKSQRRAISKCYKKALKLNKTLKGQMILYFTVNDVDGTFSEVSVGQSSLDDPRLKRCVVKRTSRLKLANAPDKPVRVTYPMKFVIVARR
jgi:hypothetical protein